MKRLRIDVAYDGTGYAGWQIQPNGITVQEKLESALAEICGVPVKIHGSGRTDQGVHARRQVAHVDLRNPPESKGLRRGLNALLPADIRVLRIVTAPSGFHARRSARAKEYRYFIWNAEVLPPHCRHTHTHVRNRLDVPSMARAASLLEGRHDFAAFTANPNRAVESTVRRLERLEVCKRGARIVVKAKGEGFLYKMVRSLAGFLIRVGEGAAPARSAGEILASRRRTARVPTAPSRGLFLWDVFY